MTKNILFFITFLPFSVCLSQAAVEGPRRLSIQTAEWYVAFSDMQGNRHEGPCQSLRLYDSVDGNIAEVWYKPEGDSAYLFNFQIFDTRYQKLGLGKVLWTCAVADVVSMFPAVEKLVWDAQSAGYMTDDELKGFYKRLGGQNTVNNRFEMNLWQMQAQNMFFDYKKISQTVRSGAQFVFGVPRSIPGYCYIDVDGNAAAGLAF